MGARGKVLPPDKKEIALKNGLSLQTVYRRIRDGWDLEEAITKPPLGVTNLERGASGTFTSANPKGKARGVRLPIELDKEFEQILEEEGMSVGELLTVMVEDWIKIRKLNIGRTLKNE